MGNSASNANNPPRNAPAAIRTTSTSPGPGNPHRSMRTKKRSLELPDLASLALTPTSQANANNRGRQHKTASIPIPPTPPNPFQHYQQAQQTQPERAPVHLPSTTDILEQSQGEAGRAYQGFLQPPSAHQPFPPPSSRGRAAQQNQSAPRGRQQPISAREQAHVMHIQELYDRSHQHPAAPPSSPAGPSSVVSPGRGGYVPEVVHSSIPIVLGKGRLVDVVDEQVVSPLKEDLLADPVPVKIVWKGGGREVVLARAGDDEWKGRQPMERDPVNTNVWTLTILLQPGTHHVRFLVDGQWRVADDLPAAVDDQGSLANYVAVPLTYGLPGQTQPAQTNAVQVMPPPQPAAPPPRKVIPGQSFWSADSSADGETEGDAASASAHTVTRPSTGHGGRPSGEHHHHTHHHSKPTNAKEAAAAAYTLAKWTSIFPPELLEAAREEEAYLAASAGQYDSPTGNTRVTGFVPAPNIPPAPGLPRHLDKLILNSRVGEQRAGTGGSGSGSVAGGGGGSGSAAAGGGAGGAGVGGPSGIGSGQGGAARRERRERDRADRDRDRDRDRERDRDRDRDRERDRSTRSRRTNVPPPPPPSEDGTGEYEPPSLPVPTLAPVQAGVSTSAAPSGSGSGPAPGAGASTPANTSAGTLSGVGVGGVDSGASASATTSGTASAGTTTAATSPQVSLPATPTGPLSPTQTPPKMGWTGSGSGAGAGPAGNGSVTTATAIATATNGVVNGAPGTPPTTAPNATTTTTSTPLTTTTITTSTSTPPSTPYPPPPPPPYERAPISGSRAITIDTANMPALTDDGSVLPVPSHVVLHHLCTSAIRNGVLAVANTTRYRKKYLTTIYYKPT